MKVKMIMMEESLEDLTQTMKNDINLDEYYEIGMATV